MTNLTTDFDQITAYATSYGLSVTKKRAILREYLQVKIISLIYAQKQAKNLFFVGGTALRLLHGLDRFSEDLDFDSCDLSKEEIRNILDEVLLKLARENIDIDFYHNPKEKKDYYEFRFPNVLFETGISSNKEEKLTIKFDFETFWKGQEREIVTLNQYGLLVKVVTKTLNQFVVEKVVAYIHRTQNQARDLYDLVWLSTRGAKPDKKFALANGFNTAELVARGLAKYRREKLSILQSSLRPFLFYYNLCPVFFL